MDRVIVWPSQIALETDMLSTNRNLLIALGFLIQDFFGSTATVVKGLTVGPTSPASLSVQIAPGRIYSLQNVDNTAYSSLPADTTDTIMKQGIQLRATTLSCPAPLVSGQSINYRIEAAYEDSDTGNTILPYYDADNPTQPFAGPNNSADPQATARQGLISLVAKAGTPAATGSQTTPAVDSGYTSLATVTVAFGATTIVSGNITAG